MTEMLDKPIASPLITIIDNPTLPRFISSTPFDGEGNITRKNTIVDGGKAFPVEGVTLGSTTLDILKGIDKLANDIDLRGGMNSPSFWVAEITVGGMKA